MLEHFNDYISIGILILIILTFLYSLFRSLLNKVERNRIRKGMEDLYNRKEE